MFFIADLIIYVTTPPNWPQRCILTDDSDCFSNSNISKAQIVRSLMMVIKPKHVWSCFNVNFNISFQAILLCISWWIQNFGHGLLFLYVMTRLQSGRSGVCFPAGKSIFYLGHFVQNGFWAHTTICPVHSGVLVPGLKWPRSEFTFI